jgi:hypothetical protein
LGSGQSSGTNQDAPDSNSIRHIHGQPEIEPTEGGQYAQRNIATACGNVTDATITGLQGWADGGESSKVRQIDDEWIAGRVEWNEPWFEVATRLCRVDDGISRRLDKPRLKALGNAVVPQVAEFIGHCIMQFENQP